MLDEETLAQINGKYVCPPDAGPAWHEAYECGIDMSLIENALDMTPEQRLEDHQGVLNFILEIEEARQNGTG
jgi:hypothetical protein